MMRGIAAVLALLVGATSAFAAGETLPSLGLGPGASPNTLCIYDKSPDRPCVPIGVLDSTAHVFNDFLVTRPDVALDFIANTSVTSGCGPTATSCITVTRASTKYCDAVNGILTLAAINAACLTDKGILIEEARTNGIRNNSMQGGVPNGAFPTNWAYGQATGLTIASDQYGVDASGMDYLDHRLTGTAAGGTNTLFFEAGNAGSLPAANGQTWTVSVYLKLQAGSWNGIDHIDVGFQQMDDVGGVYATSARSFWGGYLPKGNALGLQRFTFTATTTQAATTILRPFVKIVPAASGAVDFTLRIGWPQIEQAAFPSSPIRTTSAAVTRAADVVKLTTPPALGSAVTAYAVCSPSAPVGYAVDQFCLDLDDGTATNRYAIRRNTGFGSATIDPGGLSSRFPWTANLLSEVALAAQNDHGSVANGRPPTTSPGAAMPSGVNRVNLGSNGATNFWNGYITNVQIWTSKRLTNEQMAVLTAPVWANAHLALDKSLGNGTTLVSGPLQALLDAVPSTGGQVFLPLGVYKINTPLIMHSNTQLACAPGASLIPDPVWIDRPAGTGLEGNLIQNLNVGNYNSTTDVGSFIDHDLSVTNCIINVPPLQGHVGFGVSGIAFRHVRNAFISGIECDYDGNCTSMLGSDGTIVENSRAKGCTNACFDHWEAPQNGILSNLYASTVNGGAGFFVTGSGTISYLGQLALHFAIDKVIIVQRGFGVGAWVMGIGLTGNVNGSQDVQISNVNIDNGPPAQQSHPCYKISGNTTNVNVKNFICSGGGQGGSGGATGAVITITPGGDNGGTPQYVRFDSGLIEHDFVNGLAVTIAAAAAATSSVTNTPEVSLPLGRSWTVPPDIQAWDPP